MDTSYNDFTETNYQKLIKMAKDNYNFISFSQYKSKGKNIIWRHDIDFSVHRAVALAQIEAEADISSTFFVYPHSIFYSVLEKDISLLLLKILDFGHKIGLHFDSSYYENNVNTSFEENLIFEKYVLEKTIGTKIDVFSFHNPDTIANTIKNSEEIGGMINAYSKYLKSNFGYCSDSNGYWRFERLEDVLKEAKHEKLQVLTHPGWWVETPMSPRQRIQRCIDGRAINVGKNYDDLLNRMCRENVK